jgi:hypothetical protein
MTWLDMDTPLTPTRNLLSSRLQLLRELAGSLESGQSALAGNDAERIARGAAHQAELCRQWGQMEEQLRREPEMQSPGSDWSGPSPSAQIEVEFATLTARIRYLTRVHCSLLRHLQRSLAILGHLVDARAATYTPELNMVRIEPRPQAGD